MSFKETIWEVLSAVRSRSPLVHNITNYVVMNWTANGLLSVGASPVMAHAPEEMDDIVSISSALVVNMGTLSAPWVASMRQAMARAKDKAIPVVFDPVGAGASAYRTQVARELCFEHRPDVVRGNASEVLAVAGESVATRGVDASCGTLSAIEGARMLARTLGSVVCVSGPVDVITDGERILLGKNGHVLMPKVTGTGCLCSAIIGACVGVHDDRFEATAAGMSVVGIAGEIAARRSSGAGSFAVAFLDALHLMGREDIERHLALELA